MVPLVLLTATAALALSANGAAAPNDLSAAEAANREFVVKNYPPGALKRGEQGRVAFRLTIEPDGSLSRCEVTESSGFSSLDDETCEIMVFNARLTPVRGEDGRAIRATQNGFIVWRLPGAPVQAPVPVAATMPQPDEVICKRSGKTGSLVAQTKQCLTRKQWLQAEQEARDAVERLQGRGNVECEATDGTC
jgi:TonB family protein